VPDGCGGGPGAEERAEFSGAARDDAVGNCQANLGERLNEAVALADEDQVVAMAKELLRLLGHLGEQRSGEPRRLVFGR
jgi:hypothetical protein